MTDLPLPPSPDPAPPASVQPTWNRKILLLCAACASLLSLWAIATTDSGISSRPRLLAQASCGNAVCDEGETCNDCDDCTCQGGYNCADRGSGYECVSPDPVCGDALCNGGETCGSCENDCGSCPICGNQQTEDGEGCDDGGVIAGDGCSDTCAVEDGWSCTTPPADRSMCTGICGDGLIRGGEGCDDGNEAGGDGCESSCDAAELNWYCSGEPSVCSLCGDSSKIGSEGCDDGGTAGGDGCSAACAVEAGYSCTGGPEIVSVCSLLCGNGTRAGDEACDDGNVAAEDGCSASCTVETGYSCAGTTPDVCSLLCGNGTRAGAETCDDGNRTNGDGCNASCAVETGYSCTTASPNVCTSVGGGWKTKIMQSVSSSAPNATHSAAPPAAASSDAAAEPDAGKSASTSQGEANALSQPIAPGTRPLEVETSHGSLIFRDIAETDAASKAVVAIAQKGLMTGYRDEAGNPLGFFGNRDAVTYAHLAKVAVLLKTKSASAEPAGSRWADPYLKRATQLGFPVFATLPKEPHSPASTEEIFQTLLLATGETPERLEKDFDAVSARSRRILTRGDLAQILLQLSSRSRGQ